jgi:hypothetical protein
MLSVKSPATSYAARKSELRTCAEAYTQNTKMKDEDEDEEKKGRREGRRRKEEEEKED